MKPNTSGRNRAHRLLDLSKRRKSRKGSRRGTWDSKAKRLRVYIRGGL